MKGFLSRIIDRQLRRLTVSAMIGIAVVATAAVTSGRSHEPRFYQASVAIDKAQTLVSPSVCGSPGQQTNAACAKLMKKAQDLLSRARDAISAAAVAADGGDVVLPRR